MSTLEPRKLAHESRAIPDLERFFLRLRPMVAIGLVIATAFSPNPPLMAAVSVLAFGLRMLVSRWVGRSQSFVVPLVFGFVVMSGFAWLAGPEPTAWGVAVGPVMAWAFLAPPRLGLPVALLLGLAVGTALALSGATWAVCTSATFSLTAMAVSVQPLARGYAERVEEVRRMAERLELALEGMNEGLWDVDLVQDSIYLAPRFLALLGFPSDYAGPDIPRRGEDWMLIVHPEDRSMAARAFRRHLRTEEAFDLELRVLRADGSFGDYRTRGKALRNAAGRPIRVVGALEDIGRRKAQEAALRVAQKRALEAAEAKSRFLASMSHEIRTPLNGVLGMLQLLARDPLGPEPMRKVELARSSASSLLSVVDDVLDFSKLEAQKVQIEAIEYDPRRLLGDLAQGLAELARDKGLRVVLDLSRLPRRPLLGDPVRIRQVVGNLCSNALKFTSSGWIRIRAGLEPTDRARLWIEVQDTGIGIAPEALVHLFEPFEQADASTTRLHGGTGLGLSISKRLCELMDGDVTARSEPDVGSVFRVDIGTKLALAEGPAPTLPKQVWVVEADADVRAALTAQLTRWGVEARGFRRVEEAPLEASPPALVLLGAADPAEALSHASALRAHGYASRIAAIVPLEHTGMSTEGPVQAWLADPVADADWEALADRAGTADASVAPPAPSVLHGRRVLVVEDNPVNREVASTLLEDLGLEVAQAEDGVEALEQLRKTTFDLVLMDCQMPRMDGFETTTAIRAGRAGPDATRVPIVALTANALPSDRAHCERVGMDDYLAKPFPFDALRDVLVRQLSPAGPPHEPE